MQLALKDNTIYIKTTKDDVYIVKGLPGVKFDKKRLCWVTPCTLEMLDRLQRIVTLPPDLESERRHLRAVQTNIDTERLKESPSPMYDYPVKVKLFTHQVRAANMAMYEFGWDPERSEST